MKFIVIKIDSLELTTTIYIPSCDFNSKDIEIDSLKFCNYIIDKLWDDNYEVDYVRNLRHPFPILLIYDNASDIVKINFLNEEDLNRFVLEHS